MKRILICSVLGFMLLSCTEEKVLEEEYVPRKVFIDILADIQIMESTDQYIRHRNPNFHLDSSYVFILDEHKVDRETFEKALEHYSSDPREYELIYDEVITRITEKQVEITGKSKD